MPYCELNEVKQNKETFQKIHNVEKRNLSLVNSLSQIEAKLELRLEHIQRDERLNVFDREELRFNLFREVFEETALELKVTRQWIVP